MKEEIGIIQQSESTLHLALVIFSKLSQIYDFLKITCL